MGANLSLLLHFFAIFPPIFQSLDTLHTQNGQSAVLGRLGQPEEDEPQHPFGGCRDGQGHLGKREDVAGDAHQKDNHPRAKRERLQKTLDASHQCGCCRKVGHRHKGSKKVTKTNPHPKILDGLAIGWQIVGRLAVPLQFAYETHLIDGNTLVNRGKVVGCVGVDSVVLLGQQFLSGRGCERYRH